MRAVFIRHRERMHQTPVWMGGLNYTDLEAPGPSRGGSRKGTPSATPSAGRVRSGAASGAQTRIAMHPGEGGGGRPDSDPLISTGGGGPESFTLYTPPAVPALFTYPHRPSTATDRDSTADTSQASKQLRVRPSTAGNGRSKARASYDDGLAHKHKRKLRSRLPSGSQTERGGGRPPMPEAEPRAEQGEEAKKKDNLVAAKGKKVFYTLQVKILGVKGMAHLHDANRNGVHAKAENAADALMYVYMVINVEGITHSSKPIRMQNHRSVMVPDETFSFELQGNVLGSLLSIKLNRRWHGEPNTKDKHEPEIGTAYVELASCLHAGGHRVAQCKLSNDAHIGSVGEAQLDLRLHSRKLDFTLSYLGDEPLFKKAGYVITPQGIHMMPQQYKKKGLPPGETIRTLQTEKFVSDEVQGYRVWRATDHDGKNTYTVKRFLITEYDPRSMLVNELDGLIDCPVHQAIMPLDAFLDRLEVVLVLDDMGGKYLRDVVEKKGKLPEQNGSIVLRQVLQALKFLHESKLRAHNDIDARNILVLPTGEVRLGGFCYSTRNVGKAQKFSGPYVHMSPERLLGLDCGFASDSWSVGILAMELLCGHPPYDMASFTGPDALFNFKKMVVTEPSPSIKRGDDYSDEARLFVDSCLHKNLKLRLSVSGLLSHPFILKYETFVPNFLGRWISKEVTGRKRRASLSAPAEQKDENSHPDSKGPKSPRSAAKRVTSPHAQLPPKKNTNIFSLIRQSAEDED